MTIGVGLLGCGTVGSGVVKLLRQRQAEIEARVGDRVEIVAVAVRDLAKARVSELGSVRLTASPAEVVHEPVSEVRSATSLV